MSGTLVVVGGEEFTEGCSFDRALVDGADEVVVIPAALAYEQPQQTIDRAEKWFDSMGVVVAPVDVYSRAAAADQHVAERVRAASVVYVTGGSSMHLRSVLKETALLDAIVGAWRSGAVVAVSGEAASVMCSHMVDSRGGAFTTGLDVVSTMTVIPRYNHWSEEKWHRTVGLAPRGLPVVGVDEATALLRAPDGAWRVEGVGDVHVFVDGEATDISRLPEGLA